MGGRLRAHPHSRGENVRIRLSRSSGPGSSPLTRGKRNVSFAKPFRKGLIPTHAGKTVGSVGVDSSASAHPHSRGENITYTPAGVRIRGSSPLTRGKPPDRPAALALCGLIPTHAGKTGAGAGCASAFGAHPHSRGENFAEAGISTSIRGSSPLTRGKPPTVRTGCTQGGLIPTHAGKTSPRP